MTCVIWKGHFQKYLKCLDSFFWRPGEKMKMCGTKCVENTIYGTFPISEYFSLGFAFLWLQSLVTYTCFRLVVSSIFFTALEKVLGFICTFCVPYWELFKPDRFSSKPDWSIVTICQTWPVSLLHHSLHAFPTLSLVFFSKQKQ